MKQPEDKLFVAGWVFFFVALVVFVPGGIWLIWTYTYDTIEWQAKIIVGGFLGAVVAGLLTWILDATLYRIRAAKAAAAEKEAQAAKRSGRPDKH